jgi:oxazoline/thiazoline dehydrogenase
MTVIEYAFRPDARIDKRQDGALVVASPRAVVPVERPAPGLAAALRRLAGGGATEEQLCELTGPSDGIALAALYYHLDRLAPLLLRRYRSSVDGLPLMTVTPISLWFKPCEVALSADVRVVLSRFAYARRYGDELVVESPLSRVRVNLHASAGAALLATLARPCSRPGIEEAAAGLTPDDATAMIEALAEAGIVRIVHADGTTDDDLRPMPAQWDFHDLLFHARSRLGRHDYPSGATYRFLGATPAPPALRQSADGEWVALYRPDIDVLMEQDVPFTRVLEQRWSIRVHGEQPITDRQLGEFLYRAARVKQVFPSHPDQPLSYEYTRRPYPGGGAMYELEIYLTVTECTGVDPGFYRYDPVGHRLCRLSGPAAHSDALVAHACRSAGLARPPQILFTLAARFERMSWKYESMAYAATLKNAGVLLQTMYLVATAMGLAPSALGGGDAERFAAAAGVDYLAEPSVGEFMLGSHPDRGPGH